MSTSNLMSLPIDIPWKRIATSWDMLAEKPNSEYPPKWQSSVSIFHYEPPKEEQRLKDRTIAFLKISCSITGVENPLTEDLKELIFDPAMLQEGHWVYHHFKPAIEKIADYYPCHGAIVQVAVFPRGKNRDIVILDFEPKKRELYFAASEGYNYIPVSRSGIEVQKGTTTTSSSSQTLGVGPMTMQSGTSSARFETLTHDVSRERRENYSYTTNITHIYHLLNSYHLGTNRAVFFLQPRPYIQDAEYSFVRGPRKLEGIQEFFLIIDRPIEIPDFCVEATLETAHLQGSKMARIVTTTELEFEDNKNKTWEPLGLDEKERDNDLESLVQQWNITPAEKRSLVIQYLDIPYTQKEAENVLGVTEEEWNAVEEVVNQIPGVSHKEDLHVIYEGALARDRRLFVTGRMSSTCPGRKPAKKGQSDTPLLDDQVFKGRAFPKSAFEANQMADEMSGQLIRSISSSDRFKYGEVSLREASFIQEPLISVLKEMPANDPYNVRLDTIKELDSKFMTQLKKVFGAKTRKEALSIEPYQLRVALDLSEAEARRLRSQLIGRGPRPQVKKGDVPVIVPDVVGTLVAEAHQLLEKNKLSVMRGISHKDSIEPKDTVINQFPDGGSVVLRGEGVTLVVSNGPVVVPDVVGVRENMAIATLTKLSLRAEGRSVVTDKQPDGCVLQITPEANTEVERNSQVVLLIAKSGKAKRRKLIK